jgi:hypothetical protein
MRAGPCCGLQANMTFRVAVFRLRPNGARSGRQSQTLAAAIASLG